MKNEESRKGVPIYILIIIILILIIAVLMYIIVMKNINENTASENEAQTNEQLSENEKNSTCIRVYVTDEEADGLEYNTQDICSAESIEKIKNIIYSGTEIDFEAEYGTFELEGASTNFEIYNTDVIELSVTAFSYNNKYFAMIVKDDGENNIVYEISENLEDYVLGLLDSKEVQEGATDNNSTDMSNMKNCSCGCQENEDCSCE